MFKTFQMKNQSNLMFVVLLKFHLQWLLFIKALFCPMSQLAGYSLHVLENIEIMMVIVMNRFWQSSTLVWSWLLKKFDSQSRKEKNTVLASSKRACQQFCRSSLGDEAAPVSKETPIHRAGCLPYTPQFLFLFQCPLPDFIWSCTWNLQQGHCIDFS